MVHPLYNTARGLVGRPVYVHHVSGRVYHGTLLNVQPHGVYLVRHAPGTRLASAETEVDANTGVDATLVYYGAGSYFAFGALTGLTLGAMAGGLWW